MLVIRKIGVMIGCVAVCGCSATATHQAKQPGRAIINHVPLHRAVSSSISTGSLLGKGAQTILDAQARWIEKYPVDIQISGKCDEGGTEEYNLALGQRRADGARRYLVSKGIPGGRMTTVSYGKEKPTAVGSDEQAWAQNRNAISSVR